MKKLIGILALLVFAGNIASAELLKNFKYDGIIEVNSMITSNGNDTNSDSKDKTSDTEARVMLNMGFDLADDASAVVTATKNNRQYGAGSQTAAGGTIDAFALEQAYLHLKGVLGLDHKIGRQYYGDSGSIVIYAGPLTWPYAPSNAANAMSAGGLDGYTAWYSNDLLNLHVATFKQAETDTAGVGDSDININGIAGSYKLSELLGLSDFLSVGAYVYERKTMATGTTPNMTLDVAGIKANGKIETLGLSYYGEMAKNYGRQAAGVNWDGSALLLGASMDVELAGKWTFSGEMTRGSGDKTSASKREDFQAINADYTPGVVWGGAGSNVGISNLTSWNLGAKWNTPMFEKMTLGGKLYHFAYTEDVTSAGQTTDTIGNELDLCVNWQHNENIGLMAYYGALMPTSKFAKFMQGSATAENDVITAMGAALTVKFGSED